MTRRQMATAPWETDPWLEHTGRSRLKLAIAYGIGALVIVGFLLLGSIAGF